MSGIRIKRIYEQPEDGDGLRVLVDRVWPRGVSKERARLALWMKEIAPSAELRRWFRHRPERFAEFGVRYEAELSGGEAPGLLKQLSDWAKQDTVTLVYAAKEERFNQAVVLKRILERNGEI